jgi:hypothetical protein
MRSGSAQRITDLEPYRKGFGGLNPLWGRGRKAEGVSLKPFLVGVTISPFDAARGGTNLPEDALFEAWSVPLSSLGGHILRLGTCKGGHFFIYFASKDILFVNPGFLFNGEIGAWRRDKEAIEALPCTPLEEEAVHG